MKELPNGKVFHKHLKEWRHKTLQNPSFNLTNILDARFFSASVFDSS